jgi:hypothetical protein
MPRMVLLERPLIVTLYGFCREAERSVHRAANPSSAWSHFQAYYRPEKRRGLEEIVDQLRAKLPASERHQPAPRRTTLGFVPPALWRRILLGWLGWGAHPAFPAPEIRFFLGALETLLAHLEHSDKPGADVLIGLRMDFAECRARLEARCSGFRELAAMRNIPYFDDDRSDAGSRDLTPDAA